MLSKIVIVLSSNIYCSIVRRRRRQFQTGAKVSFHKVRKDVLHIPKLNLTMAKSKTAPKPNLAMAIIHLGFSIKKCKFSLRDNLTVCLQLKSKFIQEPILPVTCKHHVYSR